LLHDLTHTSRDRMNAFFSPTQQMMDRDTPRKTKKNPHPTSLAKNILIQFCPERPVGIKHIRAFAQDLDQGNYGNGILVTTVAPNAAALRALEPLAERGITAEVFPEQDLLVNITKHELVPKHVLLSDEEKKVLLDRYRLKETQLPRIQANDPVAKYLGLRKGNVVKIIRKSETAGRYASYRWVY
jgi:DNA-directed RNA polymerases I, II, and III subunit RPABC1